MELNKIKCEYLNNELIKDWLFIELEDYKIRIHYKVNTEFQGAGFHFYAVKITSYDSFFIDIWENPEVECMFRGISTSDGIRHLYMGDDITGNYGHHCYADLEANIETLKEIRKLELLYCRDLD